AWGFDPTTKNADAHRAVVVGVHHGEWPRLELLIAAGRQVSVRRRRGRSRIGVRLHPSLSSGNTVSLAVTRIRWSPNDDGSHGPLAPSFAASVIHLLDGDRPNHARMNR